MPPGATGRAAGSGDAAASRRTSPSSRRSPFYNLVRGSGGDQGSGQGFIRLKDWSERPARSARAPPRWPSASAASSAAACATPTSSSCCRRRCAAWAATPASAVPAGPGRRRPGGAVGGARPADRAADERGPSSAAVRTNSLGNTAAGNRASTTTRPARWAWPRPPSTARCRSRWAAATSTTSSTAAASSACYMQGDAPCRAEPDSLMHWYVRNAQRPDGAVRGLRHQQLESTARRQLVRYNGSPAYEIQSATLAPGVSSGAAMLALEELHARDAARASATNGRAQSYQERLSGCAGAAAVRDLDAVHLPVPGRAVRELVGAVLGHAGGAAGHHRRAGRQPPRAGEQRRVLPGRPAHHGGPVRQERDPDRRVRRDAAGAGHGRARSHAGGRASSGCGRS